VGGSFVFTDSSGGATGRAAASGGIVGARGSRQPLIYRASKQRIRRIRMRPNWSGEMWLLVAWMLLLLFVIIPWLVRHAP
jgi:hypothetical protein